MRSLLLAVVVGLSICLSPSSSSSNVVEAATGIAVNCSCADCTQQQNFTTGQCFDLSSLGSTSSYLAMKRTVECDTVASTCAHLVLYKEDTRTCRSDNYFNSAAVVCGQCMRYNSTATGTIKHRLTKCTKETEEVTIFDSCDENCQNCQDTTVIHPYLKCSSGVHDTFSVYNQGLYPCDTVTERIYDDSDCSSATPKYTYTVPQFSCEWGIKWQCDQPAALPAPKTERMNVQSCSDKACTQCTSQTYRSGGCWDGTRYTCEAETTTCAHMVIHNGKGCNDFYSFYNAKCGSCNKWRGNSDKWTHTKCDNKTGNVYLYTDCNSDCSRCNVQDLVPRPHFTCEDANWGNYSIYNRGMFPCYTAKVESFIGLNSRYCFGDLERLTETVQGVCEWDHVYQCQLDVNFMVNQSDQGTMPPPTPNPQINVKHHQMVAVTIGIILAILAILAGAAFVYNYRKNIASAKQQQDMSELEETLYNDK